MESREDGRSRSRGEEENRTKRGPPPLLPKPRRPVMRNIWQEEEQEKVSTRDVWEEEEQDAFQPQQTSTPHTTPRKSFSRQIPAQKVDTSEEQEEEEYDSMYDTMEEQQQRPVETRQRDVLDEEADEENVYDTMMDEGTTHTTNEARTDLVAPDGSNITTAKILNAHADFCGWLWRSEGYFKADSRFWALIYKDRLYLYTEPKDIRERESIYLADPSIKLMRHKKGRGFVLQTTKEGKGKMKVVKHELQTANPEQCEQWIQYLQTAIEKVPQTMDFQRRSTSSINLTPPVTPTTPTAPGLGAAGRSEGAAGLAAVLTSAGRGIKMTGLGSSLTLRKTSKKVNKEPRTVSASRLDTTTDTDIDTRITPVMATANGTDMFNKPNIPTKLKPVSTKGRSSFSDSSDEEPAPSLADDEYETVEVKSQLLRPQPPLESPSEYDVPRRSELASRSSINRRLEEAAKEMSKSSRSLHKEPAPLPAPRARTVMPQTSNGGWKSGGSTGRWTAGLYGPEQKQEPVVSGSQTMGRRPQPRPDYSARVPSVRQAKPAVPSRPTVLGIEPSYSQVDKNRSRSSEQEEQSRSSRPGTLPRPHNPGSSFLHSMVQSGRLGEQEEEGRHW